MRGDHSAAAALPTAQACEQVLGGRTLMPVGAPDIAARPKYGTGGETNADGWGSGATRTFRVYGATDNALTNVTFTAKAAQGMTFVPGTTSAVLTGSPTGMGQLYANGYTAAATGIGAPVVSADGKTVTLTIAEMPTGSAFAFSVNAALDGSLQQMVIDELMVGTLKGCGSFGGCTYTLGYWKNHTAAWPAGHAPSAPFYASGLTWLTAMNGNSKGGAYYILS